MARRGLGVAVMDGSREKRALGVADGCERRAQDEIEHDLDALIGVQRPADIGQTRCSAAHAPLITLFAEHRRLALTNIGAIQLFERLTKRVRLRDQRPASASAAAISGCTASACLAHALQQHAFAQAERREHNAIETAGHHHALQHHGGIGQSVSAFRSGLFQLLKRTLALLAHNIDDLHTCARFIS